MEVTAIRANRSWIVPGRDKATSGRRPILEKGATYMALDDSERRIASIEAVDSPVPTQDGVGRDERSQSKEDPMERPYTVSRRQLLTRVAAAGGATAFTSLLGVRSQPARAATGQLVVRSTPGGTWGKANQESLFAPFAKEAGVEVVVTPATRSEERRVGKECRSR